MLKFFVLAVGSSVLFGVGVYVISPLAERVAGGLGHDPSPDPSPELRRLEEALAERLPLELSPASLSGVYVGPYDEEFDGFTTIELEPTLRYRLRFPRNPDCGTQVGEDGTWNLRDRKIEFDATWSFLGARPLEVGLLDGDLLLVLRDKWSSIAEVYRRELDPPRFEKK